jgi:hypothetical protein
MTNQGLNLGLLKFQAQQITICLDDANTTQCNKLPAGLFVFFLSVPDTKFTFREWLNTSRPQIDQ